ncbi:T9SS type A sorting domain-containing protein [Lewinella sp. LCG006]|uniref:T9SS type A sorting domain-containing protein n=1 Tax=Lewinella sp. LCG006 TaxID=3231911 RepID=UPI003460AC11
MRILFSLALVITMGGILMGQSFNYSVALEPIAIDNLGGLQSFAHGEYDGQWLIVGGRLDGLHRRQPFASFDIAGHNDQLIVVDPVQQQRWVASLETLPAALQEQLRATNLEYQQEGDYLYVLGGYGFSNLENDHTTFGQIAAIHVPGIITAIKNNGDLNPHIRYQAVEDFAVTGGQLDKIGDTYYLVGGQKFIGRYNPHGPDHGPGFFQEYTNQIRRFQLTDDGNELTITMLTPWTDTVNLHRRDYNLAAQIMPDGTPGLTLFSGVFQYEQDLPYLSSVNITANSYQVQANFEQYFNHYHCAHVSLYAASTNEMHTVFFGGMAQYYQDGNDLMQDDNVPFVNTIARVSRIADGTMSEHKLEEVMPALLGSGAEFIALPGLPMYENGVLQMDQLTADTMELGYIFGGISSSAPNIFWVNDGTQSVASNVIYRLKLIKKVSTSVEDITDGDLDLKVFPNPTTGTFTIQLNVRKSATVTVSLRDIEGKVVVTDTIKGVQPGTFTWQNQIIPPLTAGVYLLTVSTDDQRASRKVVVE